MSPVAANMYQLAANLRCWSLVPESGPPALKPGPQLWDSWITRPGAPSAPRSGCCNNWRCCPGSRCLNTRSSAPSGLPSLRGNRRRRTEDVLMNARRVHLMQMETCIKPGTIVVLRSFTTAGLLSSVGWGGGSMWGIFWSYQTVPTIWKTNKTKGKLLFKGSKRLLGNYMFTNNIVIYCKKREFRQPQQRTRKVLTFTFFKNTI